MEPTLNIGDIVIVKECNENDLKIGDIISFRKGQSVITHRIENVSEQKNKREYETKGDNNNAKDSTLIRIQDIEGIVTYTLKGVGKITLFLQNKLVIVFVILVFYLMYVYKSKIDDRKTERKLKRRYYEEKKAERISNEK